MKQLLRIIVCIFLFVLLGTVSLIRGNRTSDSRAVTTNQALADTPHQDQGDLSCCGDGGCCGW